MSRLAHFLLIKIKPTSIEQYPILQIKCIPEWFDVWYHKGTKKSIDNMRLTFEEKFLVKGMEKRVEEFYLHVGLI